MNKIGKKYVIYLRQVHLTSPNILRHQIKQKHGFSTGRFPFLYFSSCLTTIRHFSNINQTGLLNVSDTNDFILTSIKTANETKNILEMLRLHNSVMTAQQYMQALNSIFLLQKNNRSNMKNEELARSPEFTALCHKIQNYSRNLDLNDILTCVKCLSYLGVSVNSNIMQMLLQLISKMINDMSLQQITFLHFLLKELSPCPLVDALNIALPIVFEAQVQYQMDDNIYYQVEFLNYVTNRKLSQKTFDFIMSKIIKNIDQLNLRMLKSLLLCLYYKDYSTDKYIDVINTCLQQYMSRIEFIENDISYIEAILSRMLYKNFEESDIFYNEQFMNTIANYLIKKQESFENVSFIMRKFNRIGYVNCDLIDYATSLLTSNYEILEKSKFGVLLSYLASCANASHIPPGFIELKPYILKRLNIQKDVLELPWLIVTFNLAVLECWSKELLEKVFSKGFLHGFLKRSDNIRDYLMLLKLYQATMTLYPGGYKGLLPPMEIIDKAVNISLQKNDDYPLKSALEYGLGGDEYLLTGVNSKLGHSIDHLVIMRPGGYSVAIKNEIKCDNSKLFLENIIDKFSQNDNLVIGILFYKPSSYIINLNTLRGTCVLTNKSLEALGIVLLPISMDVWDGLFDYEKIPYIMRELKSITELNFMKKPNVCI